MNPALLAPTEFQALNDLIEEVNPSSFTGEAAVLLRHARASREVLAAFLETISLDKGESSQFPTSREGFEIQAHKLRGNGIRLGHIVGEIHQPSPIESSGLPVKAILSSGFNPDRGYLLRNEAVYIQGEDFYMLGRGVKNEVFGLYASEAKGAVIGKAAFSPDMANLHTLLGNRLHVNPTRLGEMVTRNFIKSQ